MSLLTQDAFETLTSDMAGEGNTRGSIYDFGRTERALDASHAAALARIAECVAYIKVLEGAELCKSCESDAKIGEFPRPHCCWCGKAVGA